MFQVESYCISLNAMINYHVNVKLVHHMFCFLSNIYHHRNAPTCYGCYSEKAKEFALLSGLPGLFLKLAYEAYTILCYDEVFPLQFKVYKITDPPTEKEKSLNGIKVISKLKKSPIAILKPIKPSLDCDSVASSVIDGFIDDTPIPGGCELFDEDHAEVPDGLQHKCRYNPIMSYEEPGRIKPCKHPSGPASREYKKLLWGELKIFIRLLKHLVYKCPKTINSSFPPGVFDFMRSLWVLCLNEVLLLQEVLGLLANMAAKCDMAKHAIACEDSSCSKGGPLMDRIVNLVLRTPIDEVKPLCFHSKK